MLLTKHPLCMQESYKLKEKVWEKILHENINKKKAGTVKLVSDKMQTSVKRHKKGHYIIQNFNSEEDITIVNIYTPNIRTPKYIEQVLMDIKGETHSDSMGILISHSHQWIHHPDKKF